MSLNRPVRAVNDFHPFGSIHRRVERHIVPSLRHGRNGLYVLGAITLSLCTTLLIRHRLPHTLSAEWKAAEKERARIQMEEPMKTHRLGDEVEIPDEFRKTVAHPNQERKELP